MIYLSSANLAVCQEKDLAEVSSDGRLLEDPLEGLVDLGTTQVGLQRLGVRFGLHQNVVVVAAADRVQRLVRRPEADDVDVAIDRKRMQEKLWPQPQNSCW